MSLIAVLIPLLFMGDIVGRLFREFAVTLSVTILVSAVVSLTLTPMMCARLLQAQAGSASRDASIASRSTSSNGIIAFYGTNAARWCCGISPRRCWSRSGTLAVTGYLFLIDPQGLLPGAGHGRDPGHFRGAADVSFPAMAERQQALAKVILQGPGGGEPVVVHRGRRHQHDASTADAFRSI